MTIKNTTGDEITAKQHLIAGAMMQMHFDEHPEVGARHGPAGRTKYMDDSMMHLSYLAESIRAQSIDMFMDYLERAQAMPESRNTMTSRLIDTLIYIDLAGGKLLTGDDYATVALFLKKGIERLKSVPPEPETLLRPDNPLGSHAEKYLSFLLKGERQKAKHLVHGLVKQNFAIPDIYEYIFQATQYQIGLLWQTNKITVAQEHYCTAATQLIMATLYSHIFDSPKKGRKLLACTVSDDLHEMGIRMVSDMFELDGWDTYYMGANMPDVDILTAINEQRPDVIAISATMPFHVSNAAALIEKIRLASKPAQFEILVGGYPFILEPLLWNRIGADGFAKDAKDALLLANKMISYKLLSNVQPGIS